MGDKAQSQKSKPSSRLAKSHFSKIEPIQQQVALAEIAGETLNLESLSPDQILYLQRTIGNNAIVQLLGSDEASAAKNSQAIQRTSEHEKGCNCASCSESIQRHHDEEIQLQRHMIQRTSEHEKGCNCASCSESIQRHHDEEIQLQRHHDEEIQLQRHHDEEIQLQRSENGQAAKIRQVAPDDGIQRHVAYEHYVLGNVAPDKLANIAFMREVKSAADDAYSPEEKQENQKKMETAKHTLQQEMSRLIEWRNDPESMADQGDKIGTVEKGEDDKWQVPVVKVPVTRDNYDEDTHHGDDRFDSIIVTYSEINTLPDFFGNPETIKRTKKATVLNMLQGVRQQAYIELANIYEELFDENVNALHNEVLLDDDFEGAIGPRAQAVNESLYEKRTEMQLNSASNEGGEGGSQQYFAALERNACHFAPYSWDQWQTYHEQARAKAAESRIAAAQAEQTSGHNDVHSESAKKHSKELANEALLLNAFGEHYLQDSFAAGHLIDKTGIMQAFVKWMGTRNKLLGLGEMGGSDRAKAQWQMTKMIANKDLEKNPQMLDDAIMNGELDSTQEAARGMGLEPTGDIIFLMWWRSAAKKDANLKSFTVDTAHEKYIRDAEKETIQGWLNTLVENNFAEKDEVNKFNPFSATRIEYIIDPAQLKAIDSTKGDSDRAYNAGTSEKSLETQASEFNLAAYATFMNNAYVQGATKYFHDTYCKQGLDVITGEDVHIGTIYGDANMLNAGAQKGVEYSAETSQKSREAIFNIINGTPDEADATAAIRKRFPTQVKIKNDEGGVVATKSLADWNTEYLHTPEMMDNAASAGARVAYKAKKDGGISDGNSINMEALANLPEPTRVDPEADHGEGGF